MDVFEAIISRRSIRRYSGEKISDNIVENLLKAAMYAPSAVNRQPWHFVVFRDRSTMHAITEIHRNAIMLQQADAAILVCWDETQQHDKGYGQVDCAAATQNILLAAHGFGLGAVWVGIYPRENRMVSMSELFNLPGNIKPFSIISLGWPSEKKETPDRFDRLKIHYEKW